MYKFTQDIYKLDPSKYLNYSSEERTRGHKYKLSKIACRLEVRKHFFSLRVVDAWNSLPATVTEAPTLNCFKNRLDKALADHHFSQFPISLPLKPHNRRATDDSDDERDPP